MSIIATRIHIPHGQIAELCRRCRVHCLAPFGSVIRDDFTPESDGDLARLRLIIQGHLLPLMQQLQASIDENLPAK